MTGNGKPALERFAVRDAEPCGRRYDEPADPFRTPFQRDRQRVLQSTSFRRLEYKTQVFVTLEHDHFRTRLTHTLEVAEIARRLAYSLRVCETLAEVIALAHDLGHSPFGHAGEMALNELMVGHGGFEHNRHSLRIVDFLEHPFPPFRGLNLTLAVREGLLKHETAYDKPAEAGSLDSGLTGLVNVGPHASLEGQIASWADRLAYDCHDLEDALGARLIDEADLADVELWAHAAQPVRDRFAESTLAAIRRPILENLLDGLIGAAVRSTNERLAESNPQTPDDIRSATRPTLCLAPQAETALTQLEHFLLTRVYRHPRLVEMDRQARETVSEVFIAFVRNPHALPDRYAARVQAEGLYRVVCDYVAGMTDRFCQRQRDQGGN